MITMSCGEERKKLACSQPEIRPAANADFCHGVKSGSTGPATQLL